MTTWRQPCAEFFAAARKSADRPSFPIPASPGSAWQPLRGRAGTSIALRFLYEHAPTADGAGAFRQSADCRRRARGRSATFRRARRRRRPGVASRRRSGSGAVWAFAARSTSQPTGPTSASPGRGCFASRASTTSRSRRGADRGCTTQPSGSASRPACMRRARAIRRSSATRTPARRSSSITAMPSAPA